VKGPQGKCGKGYGMPEPRQPGGIKSVGIVERILTGDAISKIFEYGIGNVCQQGCENIKRRTRTHHEMRQERRG
jgi:hypothetical protein